MNTSINDSFKYQGIATLSLKIGDKTVIKSVHNEGSLQLKRAFAMFMCGGTVAEEAQRYVPSRLDLIVDGRSFLKRSVPLTSPNYAKDTLSEEETWYVEYSAVIPFSSLISSIDTTKRYTLCLRCSSIGYDDVNDEIAKIEISGKDLEGLQAGVSAIIVWKLKLLNDKPNN